MASERGHDEVVQMLLDIGATDIDGEALKVASRYGYDHVVRILLEKRRGYYIQHSNFLNSAMVIASERGHDEVVQMLLDIGASDIDGEALKVVSRYGYNHIVRILLDRRREDYALYSDVLDIAKQMASENRRHKVVRTLQEFQRSFV